MAAFSNCLVYKYKLNLIIYGKNFGFTTGHFLNGVYNKSKHMPNVRNSFATFEPIQYYILY